MAVAALARRMPKQSGRSERTFATLSAELRVGADSDDLQAVPMHHEGDGFTIPGPAVHQVAAKPRRMRAYRGHLSGIGFTAIAESPVRTSDGGAGPAC
jgi:hypothetical protein